MALKRMALRDFVIVQALEIDFSAGFTVLTGETGAGKSILVDALQLALGARADSAVVREGATQADISAEFDLPAHVRPWLQEAGLPHEDTLLLRRLIDAQGKSRAWINGTPATATQLRALGEQLLDIHGQHAWQSLTRPDAVRALLDAYGRIDAQPLRALWRDWRAAQQALEQARDAQDTLQSERERLQWQVAEVDKLSPGEDEWESLSEQHTRLAHAQALLEAAQSALALLQDDDNGARSQLARVQSTLQHEAHIEPQFQALGDILASALDQLSDVEHSLQAYLRRTDLDPERLAELDTRMALWVALARRYKRPPAELVALWQGWQEALRALDAAADLGQLEANAQRAASAYAQAARGIAQQRAKAAPRLSRAITQAMQGLGMAGGTFEVALESTDPGPHGTESPAFLVAGHAGSTPRPMARVASGGELSRIALAIAVTTSELGDAGTLIFDEVDTGVGGAVAETVGRLMHQLGRDRQVLAVTHLPQVAACADHHLVVAKQRSARSTTSSVAPVQGEARVAEVARMLGGERLSETTLAHARELLQGSGHGA